MAHERAFDHFGGHTREHLYDRPRTICSPDGQGGVVWNATFQSFARYWGFEPRLCRPYRAQTKGKVESGVKYLKRNFLAGRSFIDLKDASEQWAEWNTTVADVRVHGTTHQPPLERFAEERGHLLPRAARPGFRLEARFTRIVADDLRASGKRRGGCPATAPATSPRPRRRARPRGEPSRRSVARTAGS